MTRYTPIAVAVGLVVSLTSCDTTDPADRIAGSWSVDSYVFRQMGRVSETQVVVDLALPSEGSIEITGAESATLRNVRSFDPGPNRYRLINVSTFDPDSPQPSDWFDLSFTQRTLETGLEQSLTFSRFSSGNPESYVGSATSAPYLFTENDARITIDTDLAGFNDASKMVHVEGTLTVGNRTLREGRDDVIREVTQVPLVDFNAEERQYTFKTDGSLTIVTSLRGHTQVEEGTWEVTGSRLTYAIVDGGTTIRMAEHDLEWRGSTLVLSNETDRSECGPSCRRTVMVQAAGDPESLVESWQERETLLSSVATEGE